MAANSISHVQIAVSVILIRELFLGAQSLMSDNDYSKSPSRTAHCNVLQPKLGNTAIPTDRGVEVRIEIRESKDRRILNTVSNLHLTLAWDDLSNY